VDPNNEEIKEMQNRKAAMTDWAACRMPHADSLI
jgi:hypothetical protein